MCNVNNLTQLMSHFVDCVFERCFYSCTVFSRYFLWSPSGCWRGWNFAHYVHLSRQAYVLTLWASELRKYRGCPCGCINTTSQSLCWIIRHCCLG